MRDKLLLERVMICEISPVLCQSLHAFRANLYETP